MWIDHGAKEVDGLPYWFVARFGENTPKEEEFVFCFGQIAAEDKAEDLARKHVGDRVYVLKAVKRFTAHHVAEAAEILYQGE